jgi:alpha-L-rhamnosidase
MSHYVERDGIIWTAHLAWNDRIGGPGLEVRRLRRRFTPASIPEQAIINVSAESRYVLYLNGARVGRGPLKGTLDAYYYESYDVAPLLVRGENVLAVEVRWFGADRPESEVHTYRAGLVVQGPPELDVDTPSGWTVIEDDSVRPDRTSWFANSQTFLTHMEEIDASRYPRGWHLPDYDDSAWRQATDAGPIGNMSRWGVVDTPLLNPRPIRHLSEEPRRFAELLADGTRVSPPWHVPAGESGELILSAGELTTGYPELEIEGGAGRRVQVVYGECVVYPEGAVDRAPGEDRVIPAPDGPWVKGIRDDLEHGEVAGYRDTLHLDGAPFIWEPFHWRTFWFIRISIGPGSTDFTLKRAGYRYTTYPVDRLAEFSCDRPEYSPIMDMCWRTLRLCSHETFEDCPYYEQLHYLGDARLEALTHLYLTGETDYVKRSIVLYRNSARWDGLVESRVPSYNAQIIPYFALIWVLMVEDFWDFAGSAEQDLIRSCLHAVDGTLVYFRNRLRPDGFVGPVDPWNMVDRADEWPRGEPTALVAGASTYLTCLFILAARSAARLHREAGSADDAIRWDRLVAGLTPKVREGAWSEPEGLFLEGPARTGDRLSQHSQVLAILAGVATEAQIARIRTRLVDDPALISMKLMQSYYLARALEQIGAYGAFHTSVLAPWHAMRELHLSTCAEYLPGRSDCHAWSSWPALDFIRSILGIRPDAPGFAAITVAPQTEGLDHASGGMQSPAGRIDVSWERAGTRVTARVTAPDGVSTTIVLPGGTRSFPDGGTVELTA